MVSLEMPTEPVLSCDRKIEMLAVHEPDSLLYASIDPAAHETVAAKGALRVKRSKPIIVRPARRVEVEGDGTSFFLCNLDQNVAVTMQTLSFYAAAAGTDSTIEHPAGILRKSLAEVLVHFYPIAGKLSISREGKLCVLLCNGETDHGGAYFVEAEFDGAISDFGDNPASDFAFMSQLVCEAPPEARCLLDIPLLRVQVTRFSCGGFTVGISMNHCMADGLSACEFLKSWGEITRGLALSTPPVLDRTILQARDPPRIEFEHLEFAEVDHISTIPSVELNLYDDAIAFSSFCFDSEVLSLLKREALKGEGLKRCSTFEALSGFIWRARTQALDIAPAQKIKLLFAVDGRSRLQPPLPKGFLGNGIVLTCAMTTAGELTSRSLSYAVGLVQGAIAMITDAYIRSTIDFYETTRAMPSLSSTLLITSWCRLPFRKADFGWGEAVECFPVGSPKPEVVFFLENGESHESKNSVRVLLGLPAYATAAIKELIEQLQ